MKNLNISAFIVLILALVLNGCSTVSAVKEVSSELEPIVTIAVEPTVDSVEITQETKDVSPVLQNVNEDELDQYSLKKGIIFAKTDFQGVLKKSYVKFLFQEQGNLSNNFQLLIGEKTPENVFPWDIKTVEPGYFFVELPVGEYKISTISIPVGSTIATENIDISLNVKNNAITYVGTLKIVGTKDKIKIGGVPVIQPGFEYVPEIIDQREEAFQMFNQRYPKFSGEIGIDLMKIDNLK
ncbi:MAG: hypothetical protein A2Y03_06060 [Omnitrophica WOR_2 bacterium GWF2_38_59]|nr:MAG: hypothetical protein A2Y06_06950 [Omnitrophica WOR_2 bacterium GWA2_37_7]OGX22213.1 MAG: hypothetical protein A2Y03_06060 [Omnitrophica WOR_2 bacterium GWF2_38_59]OGX46814.1 MAG: hypothetical protein A2243_05615 [Omnitrophica WOR_2 bacterium RIFOXYA2_FULL_38_17]OGX51614.1 MAG: hypothetical protein A2267_04840 [Omnitrophica WOR_2 bacterium RIFOXYA12_FULL_38_10]OGX58790.1 MAG: hypothetical protein A2447_05975 [Omnitrophica WOR_2 bacterium RIFOXYC2_FULL_38_12]OGX59655.1 MAG: hypothetical 